jgi:DNA-binding response OmpR family regulator
MSNKKILYAEDELFLGKIVMESLQSRGFEVVMESDGGKVFSVFQKTMPDICVLDIMMPNVDGFSIAKEIRKVNKYIPIIFLSAKIQTEDVIEGFNTGGNDYLRKPFSMEELIVRVNNLLKLHQQTQFNNSSSEIKIGKYSFQDEKQLLVFEDKIQKLSHRECELIRFLIENQSRTIARKEILTAIWGHEDFFNSRNLDVYISKIRNYLQQDIDIQLITLKGVGFRFFIEK